MKTASDFALLVSQRNWDKDAVVWHGPESAMMAALPVAAGGLVTMLDLLDLFDEAIIPDSEDDLVQFFRRALREKLSSLAPVTGQRRILIVKSAGLLVRYNLGLKEFFDWFCGDRGLAVLLVESSPDKIELPPEIECRPRALLDYFVRPDLAKNCYSAA